MGTTHQITRNLGGDRLGSGSKNNVTMHNYNRSNHDLSYAWRSSMNVGTLVPFMKLIEENGDGFEINLNAVAKTIPTIGPLYGAFKLQLDIFECPLRLYNGLLHNNMTKIGMNMAQVKLPKCKYKTKVTKHNLYKPIDNSQVSSSSLIKYLGISGIGETEDTESMEVERKLQCVPTLAYWDIYKNYYANKQEEIGVVVTKQPYTYDGSLTVAKLYDNNDNLINTVNFNSEEESELPEGVTNPTDNYQALDTNSRALTVESSGYLKIGVNGQLGDTIYIVFEDAAVAAEDVYRYINYNQETNEIELARGYNYLGNPIYGIAFSAETSWGATTVLQSFDLKNIDDARIQILKKTGLNNELILNTDCNWLPYTTTFARDENGYLLSRYGQQGLGIKTYQSDLLQNWLSTEWIDGENGINAITAVDTSSGNFQIDALNLANKVYNMLNRIAVSGGTYEDWQEAVFTANTNRRAETPIYRGGLACEICFDEVISTAATEKQPLGTLGGRAVTPERGIRGGHIEIKCNEPAYIIGIVSITPRVDYSQGNDWDITELDTMDDLHKPALDGIGFEDLLQERAAWWGTYWDATNSKWVKLAMGKTPAWMNYMTNINKTYGEFADTEKMWMTLNRKYEHDEEDRGNYGIMDLTTYIDPAKYNYCFADSSIDAQNFWIQIGIEVKARRVMSAKILPNL